MVCVYDTCVVSLMYALFTLREAVLFRPCQCWSELATILLCRASAENWTWCNTQPRCCRVEIRSWLGLQTQAVRATVVSVARDGLSLGLTGRLQVVSEILSGLKPKEQTTIHQILHAKEA